MTAEQQDAAANREAEDAEWVKTMSALVLDANFNATATADSFAAQEFGKLDIDILMDTLAGANQRIAGGDLKDIEVMLFGQAHALQSIFTTLVIRACRPEASYGQMESLMRLGLKAQNQSRATLHTLVVMKNPKPVTFVAAGQANITCGPQQVNNFSAAAPEGAAGPGNQPNELLEAQHGERLDTGTAGTAGGSDPAVAALDPINGASDGGG